MTVGQSVVEPQNKYQLHTVQIEFSQNYIEFKLSDRMVCSIQPVIGLGETVPVVAQSGEDNQVIKVYFSQTTALWFSQCMHINQIAN